VDIKKIGNFIAKRRKALGYTQDELGNILKISGKAVSKWERGLSCPDVSLMSRLAVELKVSIVQLLEATDVDVSLSSNSLHVKDEAPNADFKMQKDICLSYDSDLGVVSSYLFGNNLEHTRSSVCNGLSAQMLKNRKFIGKPSVMEGVALDWYAIGEKTHLAFTSAYTRHHEHYHMNRRFEQNAQQIVNFENGVQSGIGQHDLLIKAGQVYEFAFVAKCGTDTKVSVTLSQRFGKTNYAQGTVNIPASDEWRRFTLDLAPNADDPDADLRITFENEGYLDIGCVSLMNKNNFRGMRLDAIEAMKELKISVLRWPGGNFAGEYNWFDGLLHVDERAPFESYQQLNTQPHTHGYDFHEINTDDFIALCRLIGAEPFITINPAWNTPEENAAWVEYCNGDENTKYGKLRIERGYKEPYNVMLWSLGNEFGYGHMEGDNGALGYSHLARENAVKMLEVFPNLTLCSSGPYPSKEWSQYSAKALADISKLVSLHFYGGGFGNGPSYKTPEITNTTYETCVNSVKTARQKIRELSEQLRDTDLKISFDEWNVWYGWYRPSCVTDGIFTAMMMNMIINEAHNGNVSFSCQFEAMNESAVKITPAGVSITATGQALSLMAEHSGASLLYCDDCTVATKNENLVTVTMVNPSLNKTMPFSVSDVKNVISAHLYHGRSLRPHERFEIIRLENNAQNGVYKVEVPAHSISVLRYLI